MRRLTLLATCALAGSVLLGADEMSVNFDPKVDFSIFKTFSVREQTIESRRPELDNPLFKKMLARTIASMLETRGLTETAGPPGFFVDIRITGEEVSTTRRGTAIPIGPGRRGVSSGPQSVRFTEATLVIDLVRPGDPTPIWRGVYRDAESTGSKLVQKLPDDARKLLARYPPKKSR